MGRLEVEKKSSGSTPSAGRGAKRAAGAPAKGAFVKSGGVYRGVAIGEGILGVAGRGFKEAGGGGGTYCDNTETCAVPHALVFGLKQTMMIVVGCSP